MPALKERLIHFISNVSVPYAVLAVVAVYSVIKNIYSYLDQEETRKPLGQPTGNVGMSQEMYDIVIERLTSWGGISVIVLIIALVLRHFNDKAEAEEARQEEFEKQLNEEEMQRMAERLDKKGGKKGASKQESNKNKSKSGNSEKVNKRK